MSLNAKSVKSIRKKDLTTQKTPFVAFKSFSFAHQAGLGQTVISLGALTTPPAMVAAGFVQPSPSDIAAANLLLSKGNLQLVSSLRGVLIQYDAYVITGSQTLLLNFPAEANEVFIGTVSDVAKSSLQVIDAAPLVATGVLPAGTTDFVVGQAFTRGKYPTAQVGDVIVFLDGQQVFRNAGNATASPTADGDYEELSTGSGLSSVIRFNTPDPSGDLPVLVVSNGMLAERPSDSLRAAMETLAAQNDALATTLAVVAGVPRSNFMAAPNNIDLQAFGGRVIDLEQTRARFGTSNPWVVYQPIPGRMDGAAVPAGFPGETYNGSTGLATLVSATWTLIATIPIPSIGVWRVVCAFSARNHSSGTTWTPGNDSLFGISNSNVDGGTGGDNLSSSSIGGATLANTPFINVYQNILERYVLASGPQNFYAMAQVTWTGNSPAVNATWRITRIV